MAPAPDQAFGHKSRTKPDRDRKKFQNTAAEKSIGRSKFYLLCWIFPRKGGRLPASCPRWGMRDWWWWWLRPRSCLGHLIIII